MLVNPHDKFFKQMFSKKEVARDFFDNYLPEELLKIVDTESLEIRKDSFIGADYKDRFSDLIYEVNIRNEEGYIYCLFEHKSYTDKLVSLQLLKYLTRIWDLHLKQNKGEKLPVILPIVIYHGQRKYNIKSNFNSLVKELPGTERFVPDFEFLFYNFSSHSKEQIVGSVQLPYMLG
jgi:predicted transposase/invertase (TIGR01784 family)